jgi:hypothetical protein
MRAAHGAPADCGRARRRGGPPPSELSTKSIGPVTGPISFVSSNEEIAWLSLSARRPEPERRGPRQRRGSSRSG